MISKYTVERKTQRETDTNARQLDIDIVSCLNCQRLNRKLGTVIGVGRRLE